MKITGELLTRNWVLNLVSQAAVLIVALPAMPYIVRHLGPERFGILSVAWVLLGYLGFFDLGLGRATTKVVAEYLATGNLRQIPGVVWTSVWSQALLGLGGGLLAAMVTPLLVHHFLKVPPELIGETQASFYLLAASLPLILAANALRGVLEAGQRFDLVNFVRVPVNASIFLLPAVALRFGAHLPGIVLFLVLARAGATVAYLLLCFRLFPVLRHDFSVDSRIFRRLFAYGGWVTVSSLVGPLLAYLDRFAIGAVISMAAVGFYTVPSEAINRLFIIPGSLSTTIFPAFSALDATDSRKRLEELCIRSLKALLLILGPISLLVILFAKEMLQAWLGSDFAATGTLVLQILSAGALINALAFVPFGMLQALGKPALTARFHLLELPVYALLLWVLLVRLGVAGAALAWTIRVFLDAVLLFGAAAWFKWISLRNLIVSRLLKSAVVVFILGVLLAFLWLFQESTGTKCILAGVLAACFVIFAWKYLLDVRDRTLLLSAFGQRRTSWAGAE